MKSKSTFLGLEGIIKTMAVSSWNSDIFINQSEDILKRAWSYTNAATNKGWTLYTQWTAVQSTGNEGEIQQAFTGVLRSYCMSHRITV